MASRIIYERDVQIPVRDGEPLRANIYRPMPDERHDEPHPVLMTYGPYG